MKISSTPVLPTSLPVQRQGAVTEVARISSVKQEAKQLPPKPPDAVLPDATPAQIEQVMAAVGQLESTREFEPLASGDRNATLSRQAINAYESHTRSEQRDFVRSVVAGVDLFV